MTVQFPQSTCEFLKDLASNNNRDWFADNRNYYEKAWLEPAINYVSALSDAMSRLKPPHKCQPKINGSIRRLHRDTRFSKDKTPFDPRMHLVFWTGDHPNRSPAIHVVLYADRAGFGAGQFAMTKDELDRYRSAVSGNGKALQRLDTILGELADKGCPLSEETLKTVPRDMVVSGPHETLVKRKGLVVKTSEDGWPPETLCDTGQMGEFFNAAARLNHWLVEHVHQVSRGD